MNQAGGASILLQEPPQWAVLASRGSNLNSPPPPTASPIPSDASYVMSSSSQMAGGEQGLFTIKWAELKVRHNYSINDSNLKPSSSSLIRRTFES